MSLRAIIVSLLVLVTCTSCGSSSTKSTPGDTSRSSDASPRLTDLDSVGELRTLFNAHAGEPRLILLMSPT